MVLRGAFGPTLFVPVYSEDVPSRASSSSSSSRPKTAGSRVSSTTSCPPTSWRSTPSSLPSPPVTPLHTIREESPRRCRSAPVGFKPCRTPEIRLLSSAIGRKTISTSTTYLTPVMKEQRDYTTNRQARFVKPYADCAKVQNLDLINDCAKCNLSQATSMANDEDRMRDLVHEVRTDINSDSKKVKILYDHSIPSNHKPPVPRNGSRVVELETVPASEQLWQKADDIIASICGKREAQPKTAWDSMLPKTPKFETLKPEDVEIDGEFLKYEQNPRPFRYVKKSHRAYEKEPGRLLKLRNSVLPNFPDFLESDYLSREGNQKVWDWLVSDMRQSAHDYFMSICG